MISIAQHLLERQRQINFNEKSLFDTALFKKALKVADSNNPKHWPMIIRWLDLAIDKAELTPTIKHLYLLKSKIHLRQAHERIRFANAAMLYSLYQKPDDPAH